ncbi:MAG: Gfo/Idh/MocA family oxidoreductase, partial [Spirochaetaceae bacterium]|nr:Gfo/Idh/MocA family oxidoreductase [Spirochaetaceae bacterium]
GIVGAGIAATEFHVPALLGLSDQFQIVGVADTSEERCSSILALVPGAKAYDGHQQIIADPDIEVVDVVVPVRHHMEIAREALRNGKHVILEKPISGSLDDAEELTVEAKSQPQVAMIAENFLYRNSVRQMRQLIDGDSVGTVRTVIVDFAACIPASSPYAATGWRTEPAYLGNFVVDVGIHHMAMIQYLCGQLDSSHAMLQSVNAELGDLDGMSMQFTTDGGILGIFNMFLSAPGISHDRITMIGDTGTIVGEQVGSVFGDYVITISREGGSRSLSFTNDTGYVQEFDVFHAAVREGAPVLSTFQRGRDDLAALIKPIREAVDSGRLMRG